MRDYIVIDLEMTGLNPKRDAVLEVGAVKIRGKKRVEELNFFVNPGCAIRQEVTALTGITEEMVRNGIPAQEAIHRVAEFTEGEILVGHNVIFDYSFLKQLAVNERISFERKAVDTLKLARRFLQEPPQKTLDSLCEYFGIKRARNHRALEDARATQELYELLEQQYFDENEAAFEPKPLLYKPKRQTPATFAQKKHLKELLDYHKIETDVSLDELTRSEASRRIDKILLEYGRIPKR